MQRGILIVISGFSGAGKGTLMKRLLSDYENYALSVSMTTRSMREGEQEGKDYFFVNREQFKTAIANNQLIEHAQYCGNYYGTPRDYVEKQLSQGKDVILEIEVQGAMQVKKMFPETLFLFVTPPNATELVKRLKNRGTESDDVILTRMKRAVDESEGMSNYEYIVVNDNLDACVKQMHDIINSARFNVNREKDFIEKIKEELKALTKGV